MRTLALGRWVWGVGAVVLLAAGCGRGAPGAGNGEGEPTPPEQVTPGNPVTPPPQPIERPRYTWVLEKDAQGWPKLQTHVEEYELVISDANLHLLMTRGIWDKNLMVPGEFKAHGKSWQVQVRLRGESSRRNPKKSFHVRFPNENRFEGRNRTELLAEWSDGGVLTDKVWYDYGSFLGLRMPLARYVFLKLNGKDYGVFTEIESVAKDFLEPHGFNKDSDIYRCGMFDCELRMLPQNPIQRPWTKRTNDKEPWDALWHFLATVHKTPAEDFARVMSQRMDVDAYITWMVMDGMIGQAFQGDTRSFLVQDKKTRLWTYVPWDLNNSRAVFNREGPVTQAPRSRHPLGPGFTAYDPHAYDLAAFRVGLGYTDIRPTWSNLSQRFFDDPLLRARYLAKMRAVLDTQFSEAVLGARIDATARLISELVKRDPYIDQAFPPASAAFLRRFVRERREYLLRQLPNLEKFAPSPLRIATVGKDASGRWFATVHNGSATAVALGDINVTANTREPTAARLPALTLAPGESATFWSPAGAGELALPLTISPTRAELALFSTDGRRPHDVLFIPDLHNGQQYTRARQEQR